MKYCRKHWSCSEEEGSGCLLGGKRTPASRILSMYSQELLILQRAIIQALSAAFS